MLEHFVSVRRSVGDSTVTSLSHLIKLIPEDELPGHIEDQVMLLEQAEIDLEEAATYYSKLLRERESFKKLGADYDKPSEIDFLKLRLRALFYIGLKYRLTL